MNINKMYRDTILSQANELNTKAALNPTEKILVENIIGLIAVVDIYEETLVRLIGKGLMQ